MQAIVTGPSVIAFAIFAAVFPVHGAIINISSSAFGPIGSAVTIEFIGDFPVIACSLFLKSSAVLNLVSKLLTESDIIG